MSATRIAPALGFVLASFGSAIAQETTLVSVDSAGNQGDHGSGLPALSADATVVAFRSFATNFASGDTNGTYDVFVHDRSSGLTECVSVDPAGAVGDDASDVGAVSADGRIVAFESFATNLVVNDTNGKYDVFVRDRTTGVTERVSVDSSGAEGNGSSGFDGFADSAALSADGRFVAFASFATNLVAGDTNGFVDLFVHDRTTGGTERVSVDSSGAEANGDSSAPAISADGRFVAFKSFATNLVAGDTNGFADIFVHDRATGTTERVSVDSAGQEGFGACNLSAISADGRFVAFDSRANLVADDMNGAWDVFVHDRTTGTTERVSVDSTGQEGRARSVHPSLSADGRIVAFASLAPNFAPGDKNGAYDVFVHDRSNGLTTRVSVDSAGAGADSGSGSPSLAADGLTIAFDSYADNLVAGDSNGFEDVFVHELCSLPATWSNYGAGFAGTNGVPSFTSRQDPVLGTTITLDLANSLGSATVGLEVVGFQRTVIHSSWGGDLLVVPAFVTPITLASGGATFTGALPEDATLCGVVLDLQAIEADPGAVHGVSFTAGLELTLGH
jgi:Tol biopolymer transport system component